MNPRKSGEVYTFWCPQCGHRFDVSATFEFVLLPGERRRKRPAIIDFLSSDEWKMFCSASAGERIIFGIGKFTEANGQPPDYEELASFVNLSRQTISTFVHGHPELVFVEEQKKDSAGKFEGSHLRLKERACMVYDMIRTVSENEDKFPSKNVLM
jgi:hypothetical protein